MSEEIRFIDLFSGIGGFRWGLERANYSAYEQIANGDASSRGTGFEEKCEPQLSTCLAELERADKSETGGNQVQGSSNGREEVGGSRIQCLPSRGENGCGGRSPEEHPYYGLEKANIWNGLPITKTRRNSPNPSSGELRQNMAGRVQSQNTIHNIGLERAGGYRCVWSNDWNKYANQVYTARFGTENHYSGDIREIDASDIPPHDLLCGGFPCQSFSVAGKRKGFTDTRGTLFFEILRIAKHHRPSLLLLENVKGLLSAPLVDEAGDTIPGTHGRVFETILKSLEDVGYWWEYQVLNSKNYGVPQNRERVFIIGHLAGSGGRSIFPITETDGLANQNGRGGSTVQAEVGSAIHSRYGAGWRAHGQEQLISTAIDGNYYKGVDRHGQRTMILDTFNRGAKEEEAYSLKTNPSITSSAVIAVQPYIQPYPHGKNKGTPKELPHIRATNGAPHNELLVTPDVSRIPLKFIKRNEKNWVKDEAYTVDSVNTGGVIIADRTRSYAGKGRNIESPKPFTNALSSVQKDNLLLFLNATNPHNSEEKRTYHLSDTARTIKTGIGGRGEQESYVLKNARIRRLTPIECERLQGFPDGWTEWGIDENGEKVKISDTQRYKMLGNAVTTNVITFLGKQILSSFSKSLRRP